MIPPPSSRRLKRKPKCIAQGCIALASKASLCNKHYLRKWRHGSTDTSLLPRNPDGYVGALGYVMTCVNGKKAYQHRAMAHRALGRPLPKGAIIHHVTEDRTDNIGWCKLVICPSDAYHKLIHRLMREKNISFKTGWPNGPVERPAQASLQPGK